MAGNMSNYAMPSPLTPSSEKKEKSFGVKVARAILGSTREYVELRNAVIAKNKRFSNGNQPVQPYLDQMGIDGKNPLVNIRFKPRPIAPKFKRVIVNGYTQRKEKIRLESLSKDIKDRKDKRRNDAMFRKDYAEQIAQLNEMSGIQVEDPNAFVPDSEEHNDIYFSLNDREREELILQKSVDYIIRDNDIDQLKAKVLTECFEANMFGIYAYSDRSGRFCFDFIASEDCLYSNSLRDDLSDIDYAGRRLRMSIANLRSKFSMGRDDEKQLYEMAKMFGGQFGNTSTPYDWDYRWQDSYTRPYDSHMVQIAHVWWKCSDDIEDGIRAQMAYEGYWIEGSDTMLQWGLCNNMARVGLEGRDILCPFLFHMVDNDGTLMTKSLLDNMIDSIEVMDLTILKLKQLIAKVRPNGYIIDIRGLDGIDLGDGDLDPLEIADIRAQTGDTYYSSKDEDDNDIAPPIRDDLASMGSQVQELLTIYNAELNNIRDYLGVNEYREGGKVPAKLGLGVLQAQLDSSNTATYSIYMAWATTLKRLARLTCIRISDELTYNTNPDKGLLAILSDDNVELFRERSDITKSQYDIAIDLEMEEQQKQQREQNINTALSTQSIKLQDAEYIRNIGDYALGMRYLAYFTEKREKDIAEKTDKMNKANADYQTQTAVQGEKAKQETIQIELGMKQAITKTEGDQKRLANLEAMAYKLIELSQQNGTPINPEYMPIVEKVIANMALGLDIDGASKEAEAEAIEQEEMQRIDEEEAMLQQQAEGGVPLG